MKITNYRANKLKRFNYSEIGRRCDVSRQAVYQWVENKRIPDEHIGLVEEYTRMKLY